MRTDDSFTLTALFATALVRHSCHRENSSGLGFQAYFEKIVRQFSALPPVQQFPWERDQVTKKGKLISTDFEQKYRKEGRTIFYAGFEKS
jgi:hypothetical protein